MDPIHHARASSSHDSRAVQGVPRRLWRPSGSEKCGQRRHPAKRGGCCCQALRIGARYAEDPGMPHTPTGMSLLSTLQPHHQKRSPAQRGRSQVKVVGNSLEPCGGLGHRQWHLRESTVRSQAWGRSLLASMIPWYCPNVSTLVSWQGIWEVGAAMQVKSWSCNCLDSPHPCCASWSKWLGQHACVVR